MQIIPGICETALLRELLPWLKKEKFLLHSAEVKKQKGRIRTIK